MNEQLLTEFEVFFIASYGRDSSQALAEYVADTVRNKDQWARVINENYGDNYAGLTMNQRREFFDLNASTAQILGPTEGVGRQRLTLAHLLELGAVTDRETLSIGCGAGQYEIFLAARGLVRANITAVDFSQVSLDHAQKVARRAGVKNITFVNQVGSEIDYQDSFDQVWLIDSLQWMPEWRDCLKRAVRALRNEGKLFANLDKPTPLVKIDETDLAAVLIASGMDINGSVFGEDDEPDHQRVSLLATKSAPTNALFIPRSLS